MDYSRVFFEGGRGLCISNYNFVGVETYGNTHTLYRCQGYVCYIFPFIKLTQEIGYPEQIWQSCIFPPFFLTGSNFNSAQTIPINATEVLSCGDKIGYEKCKKGQRVNTRSELSNIWPR